MNARTRGRIEQQQRQIKRRVHAADAVEFFNILTAPELLQITEAHLPEYRERLYPPTVTLSMFLSQALSADRSCQQVVNAWQAQRVAEGLSAHSVLTGGYCRARQRLPQGMVDALVRASGQLVSQRARREWLWQGRAVKLLDGTTMSMPDTLANQQCFPQSCRQAAGVGFPLARLVGVICLATGAVLNAAVGACVGKGGSELALTRQLYEAFQRSDIALGDALYCNYFLICALQRLGVDVLFEQQGGRRTDFRRGERLGQRDHLVHWPRPRRAEWMSDEQYAELPEQLCLREVRVGARVLVTTMLNASALHKRALGALYERRWAVELDLRNIKTTLGMQVLSCMSAQMNQKQIWVGLLAYNLIRLLMSAAAQHAQCRPRQLSFKHTLQLWRHWRAHYRLEDPQHLDQLLSLITAHRCGNRPGRKEPRARKRRPQMYPWLSTPRATARQTLRRARAA
jgi:Transposase DDE domain